MKARRQREIIGLVRSRRLRTQDELSAALAERAIEASQVTLSRDLRELGIVKAATGYVESNRAEDRSAALRSLASIAARFLVNVGTAQNLVVLRTVPGGANALAQHLDEVEWPEIVGTIAGDDTIFVATADAAAASRVRAMIDSL